MVRCHETANWVATAGEPVRAYVTEVAVQSKPGAA
jgi:hypothetical protein